MVFPPLANEYFVASHGYWVLAFNVSNSKSGSLSSERTLNCSAKELESKGLKLLVKVTPVLPSMVTTEPVAAEEAPSRGHHHADRETRQGSQHNSYFSIHFLPLYC